VSYGWRSSFNPVHLYKYWFYILNAKIFFLTDASFWLRYCREGQVRVNLWHGCGFKDRKNNKVGLPLRDNFEYMTVISPLYADIHAKEYGLNKEQLLVTGLAKQDLLFRPPEKGLDELLNLKKAAKYIFWLPTFRVAAEGLEKLNEYQLQSELGLPVILNERQMDGMDKLLQELNTFLVIKLHPIQNNSSVTHKKYENIAVIDNVDISKTHLQINTLLSKADALISDYSSAAVDYMLLDRPIAFTLDDAERYQKSRGFVFENIHDWLPGKEIYTYDEFIGFIKVSAGNIDSTAEKRRALLDKMHTYHDGNSCKRILDILNI
jgi:CDP-glycerol glycerophosphotransferase (TagB/SpsB family)